MLETSVRVHSLRSIRRGLAEAMLGLAVFVAGCYTARLVTLTPGASEGRAVESARTRLTDADVRRVKQIADEISAHFGFTRDPPIDADAEAELFDSRHGNLLVYYSFSGLTPTPTYLSLHLPDDRSHLIVAIHDRSHTVDRTEIVRLLQADFERVFEEAFPHYTVKVK